MPWPRTFTQTVPVARGSAVSPEIRWCVAESVWRFAAENNLEVASFREIDPLRHDLIPVSTARMAGGKREDFDWRVFEAVMNRA